MNTAAFMLMLVLYACSLMAQGQKVARTKFVAGVSGPELLHAGLTHRLANSSLVGFNAGLGPSAGSVWPAISLEHRWYVGRNNARSGWKAWFLRQGTTYFPSARARQQITLNLTAGKDFPFKNGRNGMTIDAGVFYLPESERSSIILVRSLNLWPALRFEFYFSI